MPTCLRACVKCVHVCLSVSSLYRAFSPYGRGVGLLLQYKGANHFCFAMMYESFPSIFHGRLEILFPVDYQR